MPTASRITSASGLRARSRFASLQSAQVLAELGDQVDGGVVLAKAPGHRSQFGRRAGVLQQMSALVHEQVYRLSGAPLR